MSSYEYSSCTSYVSLGLLKDEMIRVIRGKSSIDRDMIQQLLDENQAAIQAAQDALTAAQNKLEEIEQENKKAENDCSNGNEFNKKVKTGILTFVLNIHNGTGVTVY